MSRLRRVTEAPRRNAIVIETCDNKFLAAFDKSKRTSSPGGNLSSSGHVKGIMASHEIDTLGEHHVVPHHELSHGLHFLMQAARNTERPELAAPARTCLKTYLSSLYIREIVSSFESHRALAAHRAGTEYEGLEFDTHAKTRGEFECISSNDDCAAYITELICLPDEATTPACLQNLRFASRLRKAMCWPDWGVIPGPGDRDDDPACGIDYVSGCVGKKYRFQLQLAETFGEQLIAFNDTTEDEPDNTEQLIVHLNQIQIAVEQLVEEAHKNRREVHSPDGGKAEFTCRPHMDIQKHWKATAATSPGGKKTFVTATTAERVDAERHNPKSARGGAGGQSSTSERLTRKPRGKGSVSARKSGLFSAAGGSTSRTNPKNKKKTSAKQQKRGSRFRKGSTL